MVFIKKLIFLCFSAFPGLLHASTCIIHFQSSTGFTSVDLHFSDFRVLYLDISLIFICHIGLVGRASAQHARGQLFNTSRRSIFGISNFHVLFIISMHLDGYIHKYGLEFHQPLWFSGSVLSQLSSWSRVQFLPSQNAVRGPLGISWIAGWLVQSEEAKALVGGEARMTVWLSSGLHHHVICLETLRKIRFWFSWPASRQI